MTTTLTDLSVLPLAPERFRGLLSDGNEWESAVRTLERGRQVLDGRAVWNISSGARCGGLAELLRSLIAYARGAGIDARWEVIGASDAFFRLAKRLHNDLHGVRDDGGEYGQAERRLYEESLGASRHLAELLFPGDLVVLHDPQTAGLVPAVKDAGAHAIWRCHVGLEAPNELARRAWRFLAPYLERADAFVFARAQFPWDQLDPAKAYVIRPSLNVLSPKNQELSPEVVDAILACTGISANGEGGKTDTCFVRLDGTPGRVDRATKLLGKTALPPGAPLVLQVSGWNRLKDPAGAVELFAREIAPRAEDAHLIVAGPDLTAVVDEPEAARVFEETAARWSQLAERVKTRVHLARVPTDDPEEAAAIINALQRRATVVLQQSRGEGFGLTVLEAMWKRRPVVCARVGGLQEQVVDGVTGHLVDPDDPDEAGRAVVRLLSDPELRERIGSAGRERVRSDFLLPREADDWTKLITELLSRS